MIISTIFFLISILLNIAVLIDRIFLMPKRFFEHLKRETNRTGKCVTCERPMRIVPGKEG